MYKLIAFDLDGTLAKMGEGIPQDCLPLLKELEKRGIIIAICSGKPTYYLCGFMRQVQLKHPILIGENGGVIQIGVDLPPKEYYILPYAKEAADSIELMRKTIKSVYPAMFFQPNEIGLTAFPPEEDDFEVVAAMIRENQENLKGIDIYRQADCFDFMPKGIEKRNGLAAVGEKYGIGPEEMIAVGNDENDYSMFDYSGLSLGVLVKEPEKVDINFNTIKEVLEHLLTIIE